MKIPPAAMIEEGLAALKQVAARDIQLELDELHQASLPWVLPQFPTTVLEPFEAGYLLGLQTARAMLQQMPPGEGRSL